MNEVMNRAARRAAGMGKPSIRVSNRIDVVPMEHVATYMEHEILNEGPWFSNVPLVILQPAIDRGKADSGWWPKTLERMWETRTRKGTLPFTMDAGGRAVEIDIGLVDIVVFFEMPHGMPSPQPRRADSDRLLTENLRHLDSVCAGGLHDQMIMATALHFFHSNGSRLLHFHNLIFGLRQEVRGNVDILGPLDMEPLLKSLAASGALNIIGGMKL